MDRYSLPRQANILFGLAAGAASILFMLALRENAPSSERVLQAVLLIGLGGLAGFLVPLKLTRWMTDRRPFLGMALLTFGYMYITTIAIMTLPPIRPDFDFFTLMVSAPMIALWFCPIYLVYFIILATTGGCVFRYLGARRDYL